MSKELIEQLRELSAKRKPYVTGAHGQMIGMESYRIVANGFALECIEEAADHIEELERKVASRDAEVAFLQSRIDELMLEYCPNEMTREQLDNYAAHQRPVDESELPEAIRARGDTK